MLKKIDKLLAEAGSSKSKILWCNVWVNDMREKDEMDAAWQAWVDPRQQARARDRGIAARRRPDTRVEIMMICAK